MTTSTEPPVAHWSARLQQRVMRLLLLHDEQLFRSQFRQFVAGSALPPLPLFAQYDQYLRLRALSDELLDDLMPRIHRQLSLRTDQARLLEEAPTRGDIDWPRTLTRGWRETPGLPPTSFHTRLRQRSTATPENVLAVAVLLAFRATLQDTRRADLADEVLSTNERLPLREAEERVTRELSAAYARALLTEARAITVDPLATQVAERLRPGPNPYRDLIAWWQRFHVLTSGRATAAPRLTLASRRTDERTDAWLYELWIALEIVHLLDGQRAITPHHITVTTDVLQFGFTWAGRHFQFTYNRQYDEVLGAANTAWEHGPATRPDYTIERDVRDRIPPVQHGGVTIWSEPPVVLDAKYYLRGSDPARTHTPIKKLLGDMTLLGASSSALFFPVLPEPPAGTPITRTVTQAEHRHHAGQAQPLSVQLYQIAPDSNLTIIQERLRAVLDHACTQLWERPPVACHGVWLDVDSLNTSRSTPAAPILCPKPHIGPGVFDLVQPDVHCLKDPRVCHIIGQAVVPPLVVRALNGDDLRQQTGEQRARNDDALSQAERSGHEARAEQFRSHILTGVGRTVEQYVKLRGNTAAVEELFEQWIFGEFWKSHARALASETRHMLLSGEYVWQEYAQTTLDDWAAPAVQFCRALELEIKRRFCEPNYKSVYKLPPVGWTLGSSLFAHRYHNQLGHSKQKDAAHNWTQMLAYTHASGTAPAALFTVFQQLEADQIDKRRNMLAHSDAVPQAVAVQIRNSIIGIRQKPGALIWFAQHLEPLS